ncbi:MAG: YkgJ family cysteine cluster protein [Oligoflexia bacterium]|nr:YkgJ family cysteine cluster protein [Oligoflexia bacterium]
MTVEVTKEELLKMDLTFEAELEDERVLAKRLIKEGVVKRYRQATGLFTLATVEDDDCLFLDKESRKCTLQHDKRPSACLDFPLKRGPRVGFCPRMKKTKV